MKDSFKWRVPTSTFTRLLNSTTLIVYFGAILYTILIYPSLPAEIPIHYNLKGEADGWGSKKSIFTFPLMIGPTLLLTYVLSRFSHFFHIGNFTKSDKKRYTKMSQNMAMINSVIALTLVYSIWMVRRKAKGLSALEPWSFYVIIGLIFILSLRLIFQLRKGKNNES